MKTVFLSLGNTYDEKYSVFADALIDLFSEKQMALQSVGYNVGTHRRPVAKVIEILDKSVGAVIVAFGRVEVQEGTEKGQPLPKPTRITTPWNHIEAAMAYDRGLPLLVLAETGLKVEGLLEPGFDWFVHKMDLTPEALKGRQFQLAFDEWLKEVSERRGNKVNPGDLEKLSLKDFFLRINVFQVVSMIVGLIGLLYLAFQWGMNIGGKG